MFNGEGERPWEPEDACVPTSVYGQTKYEGELAVQELLDKPYLQACVTQKLFGRYILIERNSRGERSTTIYDERMERIC